MRDTDGSRGVGGENSSWFFGWTKIQATCVAMVKSKLLSFMTAPEI
jgi:hypothetical protein